MVVLLSGGGAECWWCVDEVVVGVSEEVVGCQWRVGEVVVGVSEEVVRCQRGVGEVVVGVGDAVVGCQWGVCGVWWWVWSVSGVLVGIWSRMSRIRRVVLLFSFVCVAAAKLMR